MQVQRSESQLDAELQEAQQRLAEIQAARAALRQQVGQGPGCARCSNAPCSSSMRPRVPARGTNTTLLPTVNFAMHAGSIGAAAGRASAAASANLWPALGAGGPVVQQPAAGRAATRPWGHGGA